MPVPSGPAALPMSGIDCPDGVARCVGGVVEASRLAVIAQPCVGPPEKCACPWERLGGCERGCVAEDVELVMPRARAFTQLCAPASADVIARPPAQGVAVPSGLCTGDLHRCASGIVVACDGVGNALALATCVSGCAEEGSALDEEGLSRDQVVALLCRH